MDTAIFRVSEFTVNTFIYCCLIFNTIKWTCFIKSLKIRDRTLFFSLPLPKPFPFYSSADSSPVPVTE